MKSMTLQIEVLDKDYELFERVAQVTGKAVFADIIYNALKGQIEAELESPLGKALGYGDESGYSHAFGKEEAGS